MVARRIASGCGGGGGGQSAGTGVVTSAGTVTLTVQTAPLQPVNAAFVAFQDGNGPWQPLRARGHRRLHA